MTATLQLAEQDGWDAVRLRRVADALGCPLADIQRQFRDLDAIADAWFERAWQAMLAEAGPDLAAQPPPQRLHRLLMAWFDALAPHREVTAAMLRGKLYPGHPHHWLPMIFNLSRTIHWLRDAAMLDATGRRRQLEEVGLSALFLATLAVWCRDGSAGQQDTRAFLERALGRSDRILGRCRDQDRSSASEHQVGG